MIWHDQKILENIKILEIKIDGFKERLLILEERISAITTQSSSTTPESAITDLRLEMEKIKNALFEKSLLTGQDRLTALGKSAKKALQERKEIKK